MYNSLKDFVELLESKGELIRITEFVDPVLEIAEITDRISKQPGGGKALLFENTGTKFPVLTNMLGSKERILYALGRDSFDEITHSMQELIKEVTSEKPTLMDKIKLLPTLGKAASWLPKRHRGTAQCQEVVYLEPDLSILPIIKCWPHDGGSFITLPLVHTKDPETGTPNVGMYRMQVFTKSTTGMHWHKHKTGAMHFDKCKDDRFPVAVAIGGDPVYTYAATAPLPQGIDEYLLAGFLRNKPVALTNCLTQPLEIPADCDIVIEGYIRTREELVTEGPFGDHTGFYSLPDLYPKLHITCITHKKDAIYPATLVGIPPQEDKYIALATEKIFLTPIQFTMVPEIIDLYLPEEGVGHNIAVVKIDKSYPGQGIKVANALWGAGQMMFNKVMIVVNEDIDIRSIEDLDMTILKNYNPQRDSHFSKGPMDILDHSSPWLGYGGKLCIDATTKYAQEGGYHQPIKEKVFHFTHSVKDREGLINIILDENEETNSRYYGLWLWGSNWDPIRDSSFDNGLLIADSRTKSKDYRDDVRDWPQKALSALKTIESIDEKWSRLGLGPFIVSPSLKFMPDS